MFAHHQWEAVLSPETAHTEDLKAEIHIWKASLNQSAECIALLEKTLSIDEAQRAKRFYFERDRRRFVVARGVLRTLLGCYLSLQPQQIQFRYSQNGKPYLSEKFYRPLQFNLSHSGELAIYAITSKRQVGIDVEVLQPFHQAEEVASQFFSENECTSILSLPKSLRTERFFELWTCKEAYIKALGEGLSHPLNQFEILQTSNDRKTIVNLSTDQQDAGHWSITSFQPGIGYIAALAVENVNLHLKYGRWLWVDFL